MTPEPLEEYLQVERAQVPDLPDRIIAATALYLGVPIISRDNKIQLSSINTIW
ncbi:PIN domain-containing protein [Scytonema hofmannii]|uniref:PIN domain-containing protein n=1 Tax=Scytonema hofmannii TaxID=34078 RepID=UPI00300FF77F